MQSVTRNAVVGDAIKPFGSGKAAFRFLIPKQKMVEDPELRKLVQDDGFMIMWFGIDRRLVMYPCVNNTVMNLVAMHPSDLSKSDGEGKSFSSFLQSDLTPQRQVLTTAVASKTFSTYMPTSARPSRLFWI
jgi:hypothetical protein